MNGERKWWRSGTAVVVWIAVGTVVVHLATGWRYGFDRDELMALDDARNLAWGYVQYPPMTAFFGWVALKLFGTSLGGFRLFASLAQAGALVLTGLMAKKIWGEEKEAISNQLSVIRERRSESGDQRAGSGGVGEAEARHGDRRGIPRSEDCARNDGDILLGGETQGKTNGLPLKANPTFGSRNWEDESHIHPQKPSMGRPRGRWEGGEWAMVVATLAGVPFCLGAGALMQYISFDYLCWVWVAYCVVRVVTGDETQNWKMENGKSVRQDNRVISDQRSVIRKRDGDVAEETLLEMESEPAPGSRYVDRADMGRSTQRPYEDEHGGVANVEKSRSLALLAMAKGEERRMAADTGGEKWWVGVGVGMGFGMLAKYTMGFLAVGVVVGVLATEARKYLRSVWLWAGVALTWLIFLPNLAWEWKRNFVSLDFLRFLHTRDVATGVTDWFLLGQLELTMLMAPLALAGLAFCFGWGRKNSDEWRVASGERAKEHRRVPVSLATQEHRQECLCHSQPESAAPDGRRILGWMYVVPLILFLVMRGRDYYLAPAYPMLYAAGAVWAERRWRMARGASCVRAREWRAEKEVISDQLSIISKSRSEIADHRPGSGGVGEFEARLGNRRGIPRCEDSARNDGSFLVGGERQGKTNGPPLKAGPTLGDGHSEEEPKTQIPTPNLGPPARPGDRADIGRSMQRPYKEKERDGARARAGIWRKVIWGALLVDIVVAGAMALPIAPIGSRWWQVAAKVDLVFPDEIGWMEFVAGVAKVRDGLPAEDRARVGILAGNYGELGALHLYGEKYGLPRAISGVNSSWERGYGDPPEVLIVVGYPREFLEQEFASVVVVGRTRNSYGVANEETLEDPDIFVCRGMKESWEEFWGKVRKYA